MARFTYDRLGKFIYPSFEQWELGFLRDVNPDRELILWFRMSYAYENYTENNPSENVEEIYKDLVGLSIGGECDTERKLALNALCNSDIPDDYVRKALEFGGFESS
ncbi:hypothetical protein C5Y96_00270 [Blastopirellula marina]|uniref:Uncharacterized protein n=2 Tax=Pirellulales TaxID=2691354 RepID=A0A2S8GBK9_9BACT|nr:hypothetical protein C5Y96_00270 [Blastopirellula marina]RCS56394.1 hypothetical protein DTL36_00270 [Bremerella cremea]